MQLVCTSELINDLYMLTQDNKLGWSTSARFERDTILGHLDSLPGWDGKTRRLIKTEYLAKNGTVLILERTAEQLVFSFVYVEFSGNVRYSTPEWRDCEDCGSVLPMVPETACFSCLDAEVA